MDCVGARVGAKVDEGVGAKVGEGVGAKVGEGVGAKVGELVVQSTVSVLVGEYCSTVKSISALGSVFIRVRSLKSIEESVQNSMRL